MRQGKKGGATVRVLVVDDDTEILEMIRHLVRNEEFEILCATSGEEALQLVAASDNLGVIMSDQKMPTMSGTDFLEKAWELAPDTLRIMLTGHGGREVAREAINKGGAYRYITKPWKNDELLQTLRDTVKIYTLILENKRLTSIINRLSADRR